MEKKSKRTCDCPNPKCPASAGTMVVKDGSVVCSYCGSVIIKGDKSE